MAKAPELFKSKSGEKIRIASTSGHVVIVGKEFRPLPEYLQKQALAEGCIPKSLYDELREEVKAELSGVISNPTNQGQPPQEDRNSAILKALEQIHKEEASGKTETPEGNKLTHQGKPVMAAVSEYAGFKVKTADVDEALR